MANKKIQAGWCEGDNLATTSVTPPTDTKAQEADVRATFDFRELRKEPVSATAKKYDHIDFTPPKGVREAAKRGLEMRKEHGRGGTAIGVARARDLSNGKTISPSTAKRMKAYFDRHQPDQKAKGFNPGEEGYPSAGKIAWSLWGDDAGYAWAKKLVKQMEAADKKVSGSTDVCVSGSHFVYAGCSCSPDDHQGQPPADMTVSNLKTLLRDVNELLTSVDEEMDLMGWAEDKVSQARLLIDSVKNYVKNDITDPQPQALEASKKPWEEKRAPEGKLSPKWRAEAEKRAKKAGRKYPNQIDNMWAAEQQNKTSASTGDKWPMYKEHWEPGEKAWFEYQCWEDDASCDAELWKHTHQQVTIIGEGNSDELCKVNSLGERIADACMKVYNVRFDDGFEYEVVEDELFTDKKYWERKDYQKDDDEAVSAKAHVLEALNAALEAHKLSAMAVGSDSFKKWFRNSKVVDDDGNPLPVYHGSDKAGFSSFEEKGPGKPGFFFTDNYHMARTYIKGRDRGDPHALPEFTSVDELKYGRKNDDDPRDVYVDITYLIDVVDEDGNEETEEYDSFEDLKEVYPGAVLPGGEEAQQSLPLDDIIEVRRRFRLVVDGNIAGDYEEDEVDDLLEEANSVGVQAPAVMKTYLRIEDPLVIDAKGANWDEIPVDGEDEDGNPTTVYYNTNEIGHWAKDTECDGAIIHNVYDCGSGGGCYEGTVYIVFNNNQIKSAYNKGTWDDSRPEIRAAKEKP